MSPAHPLLGKRAPTITLPNQDGEQVTIEPGKTGTPLAVFFYPESGTFGCTKEACSFRDALKDSEIFNRSQIQIVGISGDDVPKQKKFVDQHGLSYPILSDRTGVARKAYEVKRGMLGMTEGRVTYFITSDGIVKDVYSSVINYNDHVKFVRKILEVEEKEKEKDNKERRVNSTQASTEVVGQDPVPSAAENENAMATEGAASGTGNQ
ncbi:hypothetical protein Clacol_007448 [Clathrus columnatus]|uniref:thioredoxin-dependent peroxiredoxin n=1 Tax=Clathrus columnatus TaxID=1419009 RepID=A0AAV5AHR4_9AGAM|nr:hypothetical protein Clacol_007448 [Clathrus columnatus]